MDNLVIDYDKCIACGLCAKDCIGNVLEVRDSRLEIISPTCIECGHCIAVCPTKAISLKNLDMSEVIEIDGSINPIDPDDFLMAIKTSRSIRSFKENKVDKETIEKIIEAGRFTATAQNKQDVSLIVLENSSNINKLEGLAIDNYNSLKDKKDDKGNYILGKYRYMDFSPGFLFKHAPLVIITKSNHIINASLITKSMELMAEALGLGVFHVGLLTHVANSNEKIKEMLNVGDEKLINCLAIGYPKDVKYLRTVPREKAKITWL